MRKKKRGKFQILNFFFDWIDRKEKNNKFDVNIILDYIFYFDETNHF